MPAQCVSPHEVFVRNRPTLIPFEGRDVPHVVIEVNQKCNISCRACYKDKQNFTKPLDEVKREIDFAASVRRLSLVTLAGGEPMLHPELPEIIRYVRGKGIEAQILSNGYALTDEVLARFKSAGLKEVFLHIDSEQRRADAKGMKTEGDLNALRARIAERIVRNGLICSLVVTVYRSTLEQLADVVEFALDDPNVTRCLFTCCTDFAALERGVSATEILGCRFSAAPRQALQNLGPGHELGGDEVTIAEVKDMLRRRFGMLPFGYIGSNLDPGDERWLMYHSFVLRDPCGKRHVLHLNPSFGRLARMKYERARRRGERFAFGKVMTPRRCVELCMAYAAASLDPRIVFRTARFLGRLLRDRASIHYKDFTIQQPPRLHAGGEVDYCRDCPDATVRNGVLVPVCMADMLEPANP